MAQRNGDFSQNLVGGTVGPDAEGNTYPRRQLFDPRSSRQVTLANGSTRFVRTPYSNNMIPRTHFDPVAARMVANLEYMPLANANGERNAAGDIINNWVDSRSGKNDNELMSGRIDHQFTPNDTVYGRFSYRDSRDYNPGTFPGFGSQTDVRNFNTTISYTKVFTPRVVGRIPLRQPALVRDQWIGRWHRR